MVAYVIGDLDVKDPAAFKRYAKEVPATIAKFGGKYLVRGGKAESVEGAWQPKLVVVLEFPTMDAARRWYDSEEYRPLKELRIRAAPTNGILVEGV